MQADDKIHFFLKMRQSLYIWLKFQQLNETCNQIEPELQVGSIRMGTFML